MITFTHLITSPPSIYFLLESQKTKYSTWRKVVISLRGDEVSHREGKTEGSSAHFTTREHANRLDIHFLDEPRNPSYIQHI